MEDICLSGFTIRGNGGAYEVCTYPNTRTLENEPQRFLQLDPGSKAFGMRT